MSARKARPHCKLCKTKPAKALESRYAHADSHPVFCSARCAADYGLIRHTFSEEVWCEDCKDWVRCCDHLVVGLDD